jgi:hypothetical protein
MTMSEQPPGLSSRTYRRVRRWAKHTPNGEIALTLIAVGAGLLLVASVIAFFAF